jgi:hypothetical protein
MPSPPSDIQERASGVDELISSNPSSQSAWPVSPRLVESLNDIFSDHLQITSSVINDEENRQFTGKKCMGTDKRLSRISPNTGVNKLR